MSTDEQEPLLAAHSSLPPSRSTPSPLLPKPHSTPLPASPIPPTPSPAPPSDLYGYSLMALSTIGFSGMSFFVHLAESTYNFPPFRALFIRAVVQSTLSAVFILGSLDINELLARLTAHQRRLLAVRGVLGSLGIACIFKSLQLLPVGDAITVFFCGPVVTLLLSHAVLAERITPLDVAAASTSFFGVVLIMRPDMGVFGLGGTDADARLAGVAFALVAAFLSAVSYVIVRSLGTAIHFMTSVLALGLASIVTACLLGGGMGLGQLVRSGAGGGWILLSALFAFGGQCCLNKGLQHCRAGPGVLIRNLDVPLAYALGLLFLGERPTWLSFVGACLVLLSAVVLGVRQVMRA